MRSDFRNRNSTLLNTANVSSPRNTLTWHCWYLNRGFQMTGHTDQTACPKPWLSCHIPRKKKKIIAIVQMVTSTHLVPDICHQAHYIQRLWTSQLWEDLTSQAGPEVAAVVPSAVQLQGGSELLMKAELPCTHSLVLLVLLPHLCLQPHLPTELHNWPVPWPLNMINIKNQYPAFKVL